MARKLRPETVLAVLYLAPDGSGEPPVDQLQRSVAERADARVVLARARPLRESARDLVDRQVAEKAESLLSVQLGDVLRAGWTRYRELVEAGRRTAPDPAAQEDVRLRTHRVKATYEPEVELLLGGSCVHTFHFTLELALDVEAVSARVRGGQLVAVRGGSCSCRLELYLEDELIAEETSRTWDPELLVDLRTPLPLVEGVGV